MLANPVKAQDRWNVGREEGRGEADRAPGAWKPTRAFGFCPGSNEGAPGRFFCFCFVIYLFYLFILGCIVSSLLCAGFL